MRQRLAVPVILSAFLGWAGAAQADPVIYDNGVTPSNLGTGSELRPSRETQVADGFVLGSSSEGWRITDVHWTGVDFSGGDVTNFRIIFYADDGGMPTGDGLSDPASTALAVRNITPTPTPVGEYIFDYWVDIDPVLVDGNTQYWLTVQSVHDFGSLTTGWSRSEAAGSSFGGSYDGADTSFWTASEHEYVFSLTGSRIPAPGAAVLAMLGLTAIGWVKRRFG